MNLGELIVELSLDSEQFAQSLENIKAQAAGAASFVEKQLKNAAVGIDVDDQALYGLNKHLSLKTRHLDEVNKHFSRNPINVFVNDKQLDILNEKLKQVSGKKHVIQVEEKVTRTVVNNNQSSNSSSNNTQQELGKVIEDAILNAHRKGSGSISDAIAKAFAKPGKDLVTGFFEGITNDIGMQVGKGIRQSLAKNFGLDFGAATEKIVDKILKSFGVKIKQKSNQQGQETKGGSGQSSNNLNNISSILSSLASIASIASTINKSFPRQKKSSPKDSTQSNDSEPSSSRSKRRRNYEVELELIFLTVKVIKTLRRDIGKVKIVRNVPIDAESPPQPQSQPKAPRTLPYKTPQNIKSLPPGAESTPQPQPRVVRALPPATPPDIKALPPARTVMPAVSQPQREVATVTSSTDAKTSYAKALEEARQATKNLDKITKDSHKKNQPSQDLNQANHQKIIQDNVKQIENIKSSFMEGRKKVSNFMQSASDLGNYKEVDSIFKDFVKFSQGARTKIDSLIKESLVAGLPKPEANALASAKSVISRAIGTVKKPGGTMGSEYKGIKAKEAKEAARTGSMVQAGLEQGADPAKAYQHGQKIGQQLTDGAKNSLKIKSPSLVFAAIGGFVVAGLATGIVSSSPRLQSALSSMIASLKSFVGTHLPSIIPNMQSLFGGQLLGSIVGIFNSIYPKIQNISTRIASVISRIGVGLQPSFAKVTGYFSKVTDYFAREIFPNIHAVPAGIISALGGIGLKFTPVFEKLTGFFSTILPSINNSIQDAKNKGGASLSSVIGSVFKDAGKNLFGGNLFAALVPALTGVSGVFAPFLTKAIGGLLTGNLSNLGKGIGQNITSILKNNSAIKQGFLSNLFASFTGIDFFKKFGSGALQTPLEVSERQSRENFRSINAGGSVSGLVNSVGNTLVESLFKGGGGLSKIATAVLSPFIGGFANTPGALIQPIVGRFINDFANSEVFNQNKTTGLFGMAEAYSRGDTEAFVSRGTASVMNLGQKFGFNIDPAKISIAMGVALTAITSFHKAFNEEGLGLGKALIKGFTEAQKNWASAFDDMKRSVNKAVGRESLGEIAGDMMKRLGRGKAITKEMFDELFDAMGKAFKERALKGINPDQRDGMMTNIFSMGGSVAAMIAPITTMMSTLTPMIMPLLPVFASLGGLFNMVSPYIGKLSETIQRVEPLQRRLKFVGGGTEAGGAAEMSYARDVASNLNVPIEQAVDAYSRIAIASRNTALEGDGAKKLFEGITASISALGLSSHDASLVFMAYTQMISKGKISMEELRQQLGEKFPPAIGLFAKALNVTTAELVALSSKGALLSDTTLVKVADVLNQEYGKAAQDSTGSFTKALVKLGNVGFDIAVKLTKAFGGVFAMFTNIAATLLGVLRDTLDRIIPIFASTLIGVTAVVAVGMTTILSASPIAAVIGSIQALIISGLGKILVGIAPLTLGILSDVADDWFGAERSIMQNMYDGFSKLFVTLITAADELKRQITGLGFFDVSIGNFTNSLAEGIQSIGNFFKWLFSILPPGTVELIAMIVMFEQFMVLLRMFGEPLWNSVSKAFKGMKGGIGDMIKSLFVGLRGLKELFANTTTMMENTSGKMKGFGHSFGLMAQGIKKALTGLKTLLIETAIALTLLMASRSDLGNPVGTALDKMGSGINNALISITKNFDSLTGSINNVNKAVSSVLKLSSKGFELNILHVLGFGGESFKTDDLARDANEKDNKDFGSNIRAFFTRRGRNIFRLNPIESAKDIGALFGYRDVDPRAAELKFNAERFGVGEIATGQEFATLLSQRQVIDQFNKLERYNSEIRQALDSQNLTPGSESNLLTGNVKASVDAVKNIDKELFKLGQERRKFVLINTSAANEQVVEIDKKMDALTKERRDKVKPFIEISSDVDEMKASIKEVEEEINRTYSGSIRRSLLKYLQPIKDAVESAAQIVQRNLPVKPLEDIYQKTISALRDFEKAYETFGMNLQIQTAYQQVGVYQQGGRQVTVDKRIKDVQLENAIQRREALRMSLLMDKQAYDSLIAIQRSGGTPERKKEIDELGKKVRQDSVNLANLDLEIARSRYELSQAMIQYTKQVADFYRNNEKQAIAQMTEIKKLMKDIRYDSQTNRLRALLLGGYENIFTQFVTQIIDSLEQFKDLEQQKIDQENQIRTTKDQIVDTATQAVELLRQIPESEKIKIPITVDFGSLSAEDSIKNIAHYFDNSFQSSKQIGTETKNIDSNTLSISGNVGQIATNMNLISQLASQFNNYLGQAGGNSAAIANNLNSSLMTAQQLSGALINNQQQVAALSAAPSQPSTAPSQPSTSSQASQPSPPLPPGTLNLTQQSSYNALSTAIKLLQNKLNSPQGLTKQESVVLANYINWRSKSHPGETWGTNFFGSLGRALTRGGNIHGDKYIADQLELAYLAAAMSHDETTLGALLRINNQLGVFTNEDIYRRVGGQNKLSYPQLVEDITTAAQRHLKMTDEQVQALRNRYRNVIPSEEVFTASSPNPINRPSVSPGSPHYLSGSNPPQTNPGDARKVLQIPSTVAIPTTQATPATPSVFKVLSRRSRIANPVTTTTPATSAKPANTPTSSSSSGKTQATWQSELGDAMAKNQNSVRLALEYVAKNPKKYPNLSSKLPLGRGISDDNIGFWLFLDNPASANPDMAMLDNAVDIGTEILKIQKLPLDFHKHKVKFVDHWDDVELKFNIDGRKALEMIATGRTTNNQKYIQIARAMIPDYDTIVFSYLPKAFEEAERRGLKVLNRTTPGTSTKENKQLKPISFAPNLRGSHKSNFSSYSLGKAIASMEDMFANSLPNDEEILMASVATDTPVRVFPSAGNKRKISIPAIINEVSGFSSFITRIQDPKVIKAINDVKKHLPPKLTLNPMQLSALASLQSSAGSISQYPKLMAALRKGNIKAAAREFLDITRINGRQSQELIRKRQYEAAIFAGIVTPWTADDMQKRGVLPDLSSLGIKTKSQTASQARTQARAQGKPQTASQARTQTRAQGKPQAASQARTQTRAQAKPQTASQARTQTRAQAKPQAASQARTQTRAQGKPQAASQARTQTRAQGKPQAASQARTQTRAQAKPQPTYFPIQFRDGSRRNRPYVVVDPREADFRIVTGSDALNQALRDDEASAYVSGPMISTLFVGHGGKTSGYEIYSDIIIDGKQLHRTKNRATVRERASIHIDKQGRTRFTYGEHKGNLKDTELFFSGLHSLYNDTEKAPSNYKGGYPRPKNLLNSSAIKQYGAYIVARPRAYYALTKDGRIVFGMTKEDVTPDQLTKMLRNQGYVAAYLPDHGSVSYLVDPKTDTTHRPGRSTAPYILLGIVRKRRNNPPKKTSSSAIQQELTAFAGADTYGDIDISQFGDLGRINEGIKVASLATDMPILPSMTIAQASSSPVQLTFDDGPSEHTEAVLDALKAHNAKATFFVTGKNIRGREHILRRMVNEGHNIGNHTWSHHTSRTLQGKKLTNKDWEQEVNRTNAEIQRATGVTPKIIRLPGGDRSTGLYDYLRSSRRDLKMVGWDVDPRDWSPGATADQIQRHVLKESDPGEIILLHDGGETSRAETAKAVPGILKGLGKSKLPTSIPTDWRHQKSATAIASPQSLNLNAIAKNYNLQSAAVYDLATSSRLGSFNANQPPASAASTIKLIVADLVIKAIQQGRIKLSDNLTIRQSEVAEYSKKKAGDKISVGSAIKEMLDISTDNTLTNSLINLMGGTGNITNIAQRSGYSSTRIGNLLSIPGGRSFSNITTAEDVSKAAINILKNQSDGGKIATAAIRGNRDFGFSGESGGKIGNNSRVIGNVGIVRINGKDYIVTAFANVDGNVLSNRGIIKNATNAINAAIASPQSQAPAPSQQTQKAASTPVVAGVPKLSTGYEGLNQLAPLLAGNSHFNIATEKGRAALAVALFIGGTEFLGKGQRRRDFFDGRGDGVASGMQGFAQFNTTYHRQYIGSPQDYMNYIGQMMTGQRVLPAGGGRKFPIDDLVLAIRSGKIATGADFEKYIQTHISPSDWQAVHDGRGFSRVPGLANELVGYLRSSLGATSVASSTTQPSVPQTISVPRLNISADTVHHNQSGGYQLNPIDKEMYRGNLRVEDFTISDPKTGATNVPVRNAMAGIVQFRKEADGYGNYVDIVDPVTKTLVERIAHLEKFSDKLSPGQFVKPGTEVGIQGTTGRSSGVHVHWEGDPNVYKMYRQAITSGNFTPLLNIPQNQKAISSGGGSNQIADTQPVFQNPFAGKAFVFKPDYNPDEINLTNTSLVDLATSLPRSLEAGRVIRAAIDGNNASTPDLVRTLGQAVSRTNDLAQQLMLAQYRTADNVNDRKALDILRTMATNTMQNAQEMLNLQYQARETAIMLADRRLSARGFNYELDRDKRLSEISIDYDKTIAETQKQLDSLMSFLPRFETDPATGESVLVNKGQVSALRDMLMSPDLQKLIPEELRNMIMPMLLGTTDLIAETGQNVLSSLMELDLINSLEALKKEALENEEIRMKEKESQRISDRIRDTMSTENELRDSTIELAFKTLERTGKGDLIFTEELKNLSQIASRDSKYTKDIDDIRNTLMETEMGFKLLKLLDQRDKLRKIDATPENEEALKNIEEQINKITTENDDLESTYAKIRFIDQGYAMREQLDAIELSEFKAENKLKVFENTIAKRVEAAREMAEVATKTYNIYGLDVLAREIEKESNIANLRLDAERKRLEIEKTTDDPYRSQRIQDLNKKLDMDIRNIESEFSMIPELAKSALGSLKEGVLGFIKGVNSDGESFNLGDAIFGEKGIIRGLLDTFNDLIAQQVSQELMRIILEALNIRQFNESAASEVKAAADMNAATAVSQATANVYQFTNALVQATGVLESMSSSGSIEISTNPGLWDNAGDFMFPTFGFGVFDGGSFGGPQYDLANAVIGNPIPGIGSFANGGMVGEINRVASLERARTNRRPHLIIASEGERILNHREAKLWNELNRSGVVPYADGGVVGAQAIANKIAQNSTSSSTTVNVPVNINVDGSGNVGDINSSRLADVVQRTIQDTIKQEMRPGGSISRGNPYSR